MKGIVYDGETAEVADLEVRDPRPTEVKVKLVAAGVCHSDLSVVDGTIPFPTPLVMGHEGAGVVEAVGAEVDHLEAGDHVVIATLASCGHCAPCQTGRPTHCRQSLGTLTQPFTVNGEPAYSFASTGAFAEYTVVSSVQPVKIPSEIPLASAALIGCGVLTGVGAVFNRADVHHGQDVAVFGVGGIGLNVIQAAKLSDAGRVIAVDTVAAKEEIARQFGATDFVLAGEDVDSVEAIKAIARGGVDWAFECVGHPAVLSDAIMALDWGGNCVILGMPGWDVMGTFPITHLNYVDRGILGCRYGSARPHHDIPLLAQLYLDGKLMLDELVTATYPLDQFGTVFEDMEAGKLARGVLAL